ncbi:MAG: glycosyltransferase family 4 protein [Leptolyngbyaceae cyanobacterium bins.349]|nr:glycosyltransferase family 4 protein [Leptolyngbyaceae cyanobacterium bins.349]
MTRIILIVGTYRPTHCGVADYTYHLQQHLHQQHIETTVLTTKTVAAELQTTDVLGVVEDWSWSQLWPLVRSLHQVSGDLLHIQHAAGTYDFERAIFLLPLLLRMTDWRKPIVTTIHEYGWWEWQPQWLPQRRVEWLKTWGQSHQWWDREDGFLLTGSDAIITTNRNATQVIRSRLPNLVSAVTEIPIGANIHRFEGDRAHTRQTLRQQLGWPDDALIMAFFGFLHPVKGLETLLPAFQQVVSAYPQARLLLVGGVESLALPEEQARRYWQKLQDTIATLQLQSVVHMTGYVEAAIAAQYLNSADIGVLPFNHGVTLKSGSLLALMAHSLPIVATRSTPPDPDLDDTIVQFISPRNQEELVMELQRLLKDPELRSRLGAAGKAFSQQFDWSAIAAQHRQIYERVGNRE